MTSFHDEKGSAVVPFNGGTTGPQQQTTQRQQTYGANNSSSNTSTTTYKNNNTRYQPKTIERPKVKSDMRRVDELIEMLTYRRPDGSGSEQAFIRKWIASLGARPDSYGNYRIRIGDAPILWSCHTDSVHTYEGYQKVFVKNDVARIHKQAFMSNCLGADDATGCWIMREMIQANVPGLYIFHRGEERGGKGSTWLSTNDKDALEGIKAAVAFDRKGYGDVITSQGGTTASKEFATKLGAMLGDWWGPEYGIYTDTAEYAPHISECTNLSVGYFNQHTENEIQDLRFASWLRDKMVTLSAHEIAEMAVRKPGARFYGGYEGYEGYYSGCYSGYGRYGNYGNEEYRSPRRNVAGRSGANLATLFKEEETSTSRSSGTEEYDSDILMNMYERHIAAGGDPEEFTSLFGSFEGIDNVRQPRSAHNLVALVEKYPTTVADFLEQNGYDADDVWQHIQATWNLHGCY